MTTAVATKLTTVTITDDSIVAINHSGNTGVCIAVSVAVQLAARMLNEAGCVAEVQMEPEIPRFRVQIRGHRRLYARSTVAALVSVLREIQAMNPGVLDIVERQ